MEVIYSIDMDSSNPAEIGIVNRCMNYVDEAIDTYIIQNIDSIADAERQDDTWKGLVSRILNELEARYPPEVAKEVGAYAIDRVVARRSESPLFTDDLSHLFIKEHRKMPEGPDWLSYVKENSKSQHIGCFL
jgi:hypothetical protein